MLSPWPGINRPQTDVSKMIIIQSIGGYILVFGGYWLLGKIQTNAMTVSTGNKQYQRHTNWEISNFQNLVKSRSKRILVYVIFVSLRTN